MRRIIIFLFTIFISALVNAQVDKKSELFTTLKANDSIVFNSAFNNCKIEKLRAIISDDIEFYHDVSGIQNKNEFIDVIEKNLCANPGVFSRKLVDNSLEVFELKKDGQLYGAIQRGEHTFHIKENEKVRPTGKAKFTHLWILENKQWKLKRVLSFNHLPLKH